MKSQGRVLALVLIAVTLFSVGFASFEFMTVQRQQTMLEMQANDMVLMGQYINELEQQNNQMMQELTQTNSSLSYNPPFATLEVRQYRSGMLVGYWFHAALLTNGGKDFYKSKLYNKNFANASSYAIYIAVSNSSTTPAAGDKTIASAGAAEINANGFSRAEAAYTSTGTGTLTLVKTFTCTTAPTDIQKYGVFWNPASGDASLVWEDTSPLKHIAVGDTYEITFSITEAQG